MRLALALCLIAAPALAETCPPAPNHAAELRELQARARQAPDEASARPLLRQMWALWTDAPDAYAQELLNEGMERRDAYDFEGAIKAFDALVDHCPDYAEGYNQRAFVQFLRQDYGPALEDVDRALALNPTHLGALSGKALVLMHMGRFDEGQEVLRGAVDLDPWLPERGMLVPKPGEEL